MKIHITTPVQLQQHSKGLHFLDFKPGSEVSIATVPQLAHLVIKLVQDLRTSKQLKYVSVNYDENADRFLIDMLCDRSK